MKKSLKSRLLPFCLIGLCLFQSLSSLSSTSFAFTAVDGTIKASTLNVRSGASTKTSKVDTLRRGDRVRVVDEIKGSDNLTWYRINYNIGNTQKTGYVSKVYVNTSNSNYTYNASFEQQLSKEGFPESYKVKLRQLHASYPNWVFKAHKTGLDWNEVIRNEAEVGKLNLVHTSSRSSWKSTAQGAYDWNTSKWTGFDTAAWVAASESIIRYYMDPRNFLDESYIFQFANHTYDANIHKASGVESLVKGTFMDSKYTGNVSGNTNSDNINRGTNQGTPNIGPGGSSSTSSATTGNSESSNGGPGGSSNSTSAGSSSNIKIEPNGVRLNDAPKASVNQNSMLVAPGITYKVQEVMLVAPSSNNTSVQNNSNIIGPGGISTSTTNDSAVSVTSNGEKTYVDMIMQAATTSGVNPYVLASMIIQEQGTAGKSGLISGNTAPYQGYYNFFNIEAYKVGSTSPVQRGLWWASQNGSYLRPWNSREKAIVGGANYYGEKYVKVGQNTFYLKKYNVQGANIYKHQYMTNVEGAAHEGVNLAKAYSEDLKKGALTFSIPVFNNMPENPEPMPMGDGSPNNKLSNLSIGGYSLTPGFNRDINSYTIIVDSSVPSINISASALHNKATISGVGNINIGTGNTVVDVNVTAENGDIRSYKINVARQGQAGIQSDIQSNTSSSNVGPGGAISERSESNVNLVAP